MRTAVHGTTPVSIMKFHELIRKLLLIGIEKPAPKIETLQPPEALREIDQIVASRRRAVRAAAAAAGDKYRSAFWAIYLFSALAVLCAALPIALGWDAQDHPLRRFAGLWAVLEILLIGAVGTLFIWGNKANWQQTWIDARAEAELLRYLSVVAALLNLGKERQAGNWFASVFDVDPDGSPMLQRIDPLCTELEPLARSTLTDIWDQPSFVESFGRWVAEKLREQVRYHAETQHEEHHLTHRVHLLTLVLFVLTAAAALGHLFVHSAWLTVATIFFPALGAAFHGALVQSESKRLEMVSGHLMRELQRDVDRIETLLQQPHGSHRSQDLRQVVVRALDDILEENDGWQLLVRQHSLVPA